MTELLIYYESDITDNNRLHKCGTFAESNGLKPICFGRLADNKHYVCISTGNKYPKVLKAGIDGETIEELESSLFHLTEAIKDLMNIFAEHLNISVDQIDGYLIRMTEFSDIIEQMRARKLTKLEGDDGSVLYMNE